MTKDLSGNRTVSIVFGYLRQGVVALACLGAGASAAAALEPREREAELLTACEEKICRQILDKTPVKGLLRCDLGKTWGGKDIDKGAKSKSISWGFGDAQCSVDLEINRADIVAALTAPKHEFTVRPHDVTCTVESGNGKKPLKAQLAPKIKFEGGKAKKLWIKLKAIDGPEPLSSFVWTTAKLEDSLGLFHSEMIKQINKFVHQKCEQRYGVQAMAKKRREEVREARRAKAAERRKFRAERQALNKKRRAERAIREAKLKKLRENRAAELARQQAETTPGTSDQPAAPLTDPPPTPSPNEDAATGTDAKPRAATQ